MRFTAWGIGGPDGELVFVLSIAAAAGVVIAHHRKKYWFESLLAAAAWGTICFFWMGLLVFLRVERGLDFWPVQDQRGHRTLSGSARRPAHRGRL